METINPDKFTPRCYAFIQNELGEVLVLRERWSGMDLNKLPGGGQELGEGMHECLNREIEEEFTHFSKIVSWKHVYTPPHAFTSKFRPNEQLILNYFMASNMVDVAKWALRMDENLLGMYWLAPKKENAAWFTFDNDRNAFLAFLEALA